MKVIYAVMAVFALFIALALGMEYQAHNEAKLRAGWHETRFPAQAQASHMAVPEHVAPAPELAVPPSKLVSVIVTLQCTLVVSVVATDATGRAYAAPFGTSKAVVDAMIAKVPADNVLAITLPCTQHRDAPGLPSV